MVERPSVLIEHWLPIAELGVECQREGGTGKHPPLNRLHVWWARRPLAVSGAAVLGSVLPAWSPEWPKKLREQFAKEKGIKLPGNPYGYPRAFTISPDEGQIRTLHNLLEYTWGTRDLSVMDPMAGGGSIPFEALRYGFTTYANELNPVASIILKATLDYPAMFGEELGNEIRKLEGRMGTERPTSR